MQPTLITIGLLCLSNIFMTFAWYGHLKSLSGKPWIIAALVSWGIALFEYLLQVPANRIGYSVMNVGQLKILQEVITLSLFVPFAVFYLRKVRTSPMCALRRLTGLDARRGSQQMALVLCKKHNTAGRPVSPALWGFHSNRLSALSDFDMPRHAFSQMP